MRRYASYLVISFALAGTVFAGNTPFWGAKQPVPFETPSANLQHGEFTWAPEIAPTGPIMVLVSLDEQRAYTYRNGALIGTSTVSSGKSGHETPTGVFTTKLKDKNHHSSIYNNAPMPYTQRFTNDGVALHAGGIPGYPESHGCVHLPSEYARLLFEATPLGMTVVIADKKHFPEIVDHPPFLAPITGDGAIAANRRLFEDEAFVWSPQNSPEGPLSILLSRYDRRTVVLRNGVEIGRARIHVTDPEIPLGTQVFVAHENTGDAFRWVAVAMPGHLRPSGPKPDADAVRRIVLPHEFQQSLAPLLHSGATLMITDEPILEHSTGKEISVFSSNPTT